VHEATIEVVLGGARGRGQGKTLGRNSEAEVKPESTARFGIVDRAAPNASFVELLSRSCPPTQTSSVRILHVCYKENPANIV
jgi:hypothetical protein